MESLRGLRLGVQRLGVELQGSKNLGLCPSFKISVHGGRGQEAGTVGFISGFGCFVMRV